FSSRRRHTRSKRDWSSDVCSSDLRAKMIFDRKEQTKRVVMFPPNKIKTSAIENTGAKLRYGSNSAANRTSIAAMTVLPLKKIVRSEERRVGKECSDGGWPEQCKKK